MEKWIPVTIMKGLFPSERTVGFRTTEGDTSVFISSSFLDEARQRLKVVLLDEDDLHALVQVPSQSGTLVAKVDRSVLSSVL